MSEHWEVDGFDAVNASSAHSEPAGLRMLWRRKLLVLLGIVFGLAAGLIKYHLQPPVYKSTAQVLMVRERSDVGTERFFGDSYDVAQAKLIVSPLIVKRALIEGLLPPLNHLGPDDPINAIAESLSARAEGNILSISYRGPEPEFCRQVVVGIVTAYEAFLIENLQENREHAAQRIAERAERVRQQLAQDRMRHELLLEKLPPVLLEQSWVQQFRATANASSSLAEAYLQSLLRKVRTIEPPGTAVMEMFEEERTEADRLASLQNEVKQLGSQIAINEGFHERLISQLQQIKLRQDIGDLPTHVFAPATKGVRVEPNAWRVLGMAAILGILAGIGLAYFAENTDKQFHTPDEICHRLGLPVVGQIPRVKPKQAGLLRDSIGSDALAPTLLDYQSSKSSHAEAFRNVRMALLFGVPGGMPQVIQVTSPNVRDGKTVIAANMAVAIAQAGKRTLLIDANLRKPQIHKLFGLSATAGMSTLLAGETELHDAIHESGVSGLMIMPCGCVPSNPAELLTSPRLEALVEAIREEYDHVIVDTPALLDVADACAVAHCADGILLAIRVNQNSRCDTLKAIETMGPLAARLTGVVVNNMDGGWRPAPPVLLSSNHFPEGDRKPWASSHFGLHPAHGGRPPSVAGALSGTGPLTRPAAVPAAPPQDSTQLEPSMQQLTQDLHEVMADAKYGSAARTEMHPDQA